MDGVVIGWVGIGLVVLGNVGAVAFWGGRTTTKLSDMCQRMTKLEQLLNEHLHEHRIESSDRESERVRGKR